MKKIIFFIIYSSLIASVYAKTHHPQHFLKNIKGKKCEGALIIKHFCAVCHAEKPQIDLGAPKNKKDWGFRSKKGLNVLLEHTLQGYGAMPPRGGCFECTDEQLYLAINALLDKSLK